jgi:hypothetical protein
MLTDGMKLVICGCRGVAKFWIGNPVGWYDSGGEKAGLGFGGRKFGIGGTGGAELVAARVGMKLENPVLVGISGLSNGWLEATGASGPRAAMGFCNPVNCVGVIWPIGTGDPPMPIPC